jgi:glutaconate CoA-transferase subunit B
MSASELKYSQAEFLIATLGRLCDDAESFEIGNAMPIPASTALLVHKRNDCVPRVSILGSVKHNRLFTGGILEQYDLAGKGLLDVQFYGGGQIDQYGNINLVGVGEYPRSRVRFSGSFGTTLLYYTGRRTILFVLEHSRRVLVPKVDFISATGVSPPGVHRNGGPIALVTSKCVMDFDPKRPSFTLRSVHPGVSVDDIVENTGFEFDVAPNVGVTAEPTEQELDLLRGYVRQEVAEVYPNFAATAFL